MKIKILNKISDIKSNNIIIPIVKSEPLPKKILGVKLTKIIDNLINKDGIYSFIAPDGKCITIIFCDKNLTNRDLLKLGKKTYDALKKKKFTDYAIFLFETIIKEKKKIDLTYSFIEGLLLSNYSFETYKTKKDLVKIESIEIISKNSKVSNFIQNKKDYLGKIVSSVFLVKDLVNTPPADLTPMNFAKLIKENETSKLKVEPNLHCRKRK